jgi:hypothetical protein
MAISTYAELKSAISDWLNRDDLASVVDSFIDLAEARFRREIRHYKMEETATLSASSRYTALPADFLQPIRLYTDVRSRPLEPASREYIQSQRHATDDGVGAPRFYAITDSQMELYPTPGDATDVEVLYYEEIPALSDSQTAVDELHRASEGAKWGGPLNLRPAKRSS